MATPRFDLIDIIQVLQRNRKTVFGISILSVVVTAIGYFATPKKYEAKAAFFVSNPLYLDRSHLFRTTESRFIDYFTSVDDMEKLIAIANSKNVIQTVIHKERLYTKPFLGEDSLEWLEQATKKFEANFDIKRTEYEHLELAFRHYDPKKAAAVVNTALDEIERVYRDYYINIRSNIYLSIAEKAKETDSAILVLTDSLAKLRDQYQIYDIISPARTNLITTPIRKSGVANYGRGIEEVQNVEAIKDQLVKDRASYTSIMNEFSVGTHAQRMNLIQIISPATPPVEPAGLGLALTLVVGLVVALVFVSILLVLMAYSRRASEAARSRA